MTKFVPILALTAITALAPVNKAEAWWGCFHGGCGWRWWGPAVAVGVPLTIAATRPYYYAPGYYPYYYGGAPYYYRGGGYSVAASVQARLAQKGYYHGPVDGKIGPMSRDAIRAYQARRGLPATGQIDQPLLRSLRLG